MRVAAAAFLDRDGVLNVRADEHTYITDVGDLSMLPGASRGVARLNAAGYRVIVVSNQRGVAKDLVTLETLRAIEVHIREELGAVGGSVDAFYYCTHDVDEDCPCRKPRPGLLVRAASDWRVALERSVMIGDAETDVEAGRAAGCAVTIRIAPRDAATAADLIAVDLEEAASLVPTLRRAL